MSEQTEHALFRESIRGSLAAYPEKLGLQHADTLASDAFDNVLALAVSQGWTTLLIPEDKDGLGLGMREGIILAQEIGRALAPGNFLARIVLLPALAATGIPELLALAARVTEGAERVAVGFIDVGDVDVRPLLEGCGEPETALVLVLDGEGFSVRLFHDPKVDRRDPYDPTSPVLELQERAENSDAVELEIDEAIASKTLGMARLWLAGELVGLAERAIERSVEHARQRTQFDRPIASNQAIKHRIVDDYIRLRNASALLLDAAGAVDNGAANQTILTHAAFAAASEAALSATAHSIQVHGAMGFAAESLVHLPYKRAQRLARCIGDRAASHEKIAADLFAEAA